MRKNQNAKPFSLKLSFEEKVKSLWWDRIYGPLLQKTKNPIAQKRILGMATREFKALMQRAKI